MSRFDEVASVWEAHEGRRAMAKATVEAIKKAVDLKGKEVLDYGAGTGLLAFGLADEAEHITCMDNSYGMLKELESKIIKYNTTNIKPFLHDADNDALPEDAFDVMVSNMTLHHIRDTQTFVQGVYDSLRTDGVACIADLVSEDGSFHGDNDGVEHFGFDSAHLQAIFQSAGFVVESFETIHTMKKGAKSYDIFLIVGRKG